MALTQDTQLIDIQGLVVETFKTTLGTDEVIVGNEKVVYAEILPDLSIKEYVEPTVCFTKWNKEESLTLSYPDTLFSDKTLVDGELKLSADKEEFYFRQHDSDTMKFGLILNEIPDKSKLVTIDGVEYYQWQFKILGNDRLTQIKRPPLIKNNSDGTKTFDSSGGIGEYENSERFYRTIPYLTTNPLGEEIIIDQLEHGFTFLRPRFIDNKNNEIWADLEIQGNDYVVTVDKKWVDNAVYPVKANDSVTYQQGTLGTCYDSQIWEQNATTNYNTDEVFQITEYAANNRITLPIYWDLSALSGATISAVSIVLNQYASSGSNTIYCARLLRNWSNSQVTWNIYSTGNSWSTVGGAYNDLDRSSTTSDSQTVGAGMGDYTWSSAQLVTDVQNFVNGTWSNYGWIFWSNSGVANSYHQFRSSEYLADTSVRPKITITYTPSGGGAATSYGYLSTNKGFW